MDLLPGLEDWWILPDKCKVAHIAYLSPLTGSPSRSTPIWWLLLVYSRRSRLYSSVWKILSSDSGDSTVFAKALEMGRSAKVTKRPTKREKAASKIVKANSKLLPPPPPPAKKVVIDDEEDGGKKSVKKRKMMREKVDKVGPDILFILGFNPDDVSQKLGKT